MFNVAKLDAAVRPKASVPMEIADPRSCGPLPEAARPIVPSAPGRKTKIRITRTDCRHLSLLLRDMDFLTGPAAEAASPLNAMAPAEPLPRLLTTADMCVIFHCCSKTVGRLGKAKGLHVSKIGSRKFYRLSEIEALLGLNSPAPEE
jgi:hypothetical protein